VQFDIHSSVKIKYMLKMLKKKYKFYVYFIDNLYLNLGLCEIGALFHIYFI